MKTKTTVHSSKFRRCTNCERIQEDARQLQRVDAARIVIFATELADTEKALGTVRGALIDLWAFYERVLESRGEWTSFDLARLDEIRRMVAVAYQLRAAAAAAMQPRKVSPEKLPTGESSLPPADAEREQAP